MIDLENIQSFVGNHVAPYIYNAENFEEGKTSIYYSGPYWDNKEIEAAINSFLNGKWITAGEKVHQFESRFSTKFNVKYSHMVNSGSSANLVLIAGLKKRFNWQDDDEIIVSPVGFPTTISVLYQNRLKPVFVDIEWDTLNFDITKIEEKITDKTRGIFISPVLGNPPDMDYLTNLANKYSIVLIGDNCDSLGSKYDEKLFSDYCVAFSNSFYPAHHISTGEGGMVCTNDEALKSTFISLSWWGRDCYCVGSANLLSCGTCKRRFDNWLENHDGIIDHKYVFTNMGYNLKPLDLQGAIGIEQLKKFDVIETKRKESKERIEEIFIKNIPGLKKVQVLEKAEPCWFGTPFICEDSKTKNKLVAYLEANKIQTRNYFAGNILLHPGYKFLDDYKKYPEANKVLNKVFFVGAAPHYNESVFNYIEKVVSKYE